MSKYRLQKLAAFTLGELLVVLVITAIFVGIAFSVIRLVTYQMGAMENIYGQRIEVEKFKRQLSIDMDRGNAIFWNAQERTLTINRLRDTIRYELNQEYILKENDTIELAVSDKRGYFLGKLTDKGQVDAFFLSVETKRRIVKVFVSKADSAMQHMIGEWE